MTLHPGREPTIFAALFQLPGVADKLHSNTKRQPKIYTLILYPKSILLQGAHIQLFLSITQKYILCESTHFSKAGQIFCGLVLIILIFTLRDARLSPHLISIRNAEMHDFVKGQMNVVSMQMVTIYSQLFVPRPQQTSEHVRSIL